MLDARLAWPIPSNEPVLSYAPGTPERALLQAEIGRLRDERPEITSRIGEERPTTDQTFDVVCPHAHRHSLGRVHGAGPAHVLQAIETALRARDDWAALPFSARSAIFLRAADLLAGPWRARLNAATMLGQSKTPHQAEIDSACELIDFLRFNVSYAAQLLGQQPSSSPGCWNQLDYRPLEGFVLAITPFNFTAIAGNLPTAPALLGNVVLWKPAESATLSAHHFMLLLEEAGLPPGVINLLPGDGQTVGSTALPHPALAGIHFTGSTPTFQQIWQTVGQSVGRYRNYPRLVGETGGKDFVVAHPSADPEALVTALLRGAYEYQGQKCSAVSRAYLPRSLYGQIEPQLIAEIEAMAVGDPTDFQTFLGALINRRAFDKVDAYLELARTSVDTTILAGGTSDDSEGYFVRPTLIQTSRPDSRLLREEIFGPLLTCFVYPDDQFLPVLQHCDEATPYGLTGAIFARDRQAIEQASARLRYAAGNFYINDKPTGAVVGQQPFGGARASGTNDKAGSALNLMRWVSPRTIKETFAPPKSYRYPYMG